MYYYLWGKYLCPLDIRFYYFWKGVWYSYDFDWFLWKFFMIFCYLYPNPADQNETDPDPQHCFFFIEIRILLFLIFDYVKSFSAIHLIYIMKLHLFYTYILYMLLLHLLDLCFGQIFVFNYFPYQKNETLNFY